MRIFQRFPGRRQSVLQMPSADAEPGTAPMASRTLRLYPPEANLPSSTERAVLAGERVRGSCTVCGARKRFRPFTDNLRESGNCASCRGSNRVRQMAWMLRRELGLPMEGKLVLPEGVTLYNTQASCPMHEVLKWQPGHRCSE